MSKKYNAVANSEKDVSQTFLKGAAILTLSMVIVKVFGLLARRVKAPQVVGEIIAGLLIGPSVLHFVDQSDFITQMAAYSQRNRLRRELLSTRLK